jgi:hypothetical protein
MNAKQLSDSFEKIQSSGMKSSKVLSEMTTEGAKKISQVHANLANHVAKNMQMAAVNLMSAKTPAEAFASFKGDGSTPFIEGWHQYQQTIASTVEHYMKDYSEANEEVYEHARAGVIEFFKLACQNAPDGMDTLIKPYQSAINLSLEGADQMHVLAKNFIHNLENSFAGGGIFGKMTDLMPQEPHHKYSKKSGSLSKSL